MKPELRSRIIASAKGAAYLGLACDIVQSAHFYTKDKGLANQMIQAQKMLLDIADSFRKAGR